MSIAFYKRCTIRRSYSGNAITLLFRWFGKNSYEVYLTHMFVIMTADYGNAQQLYIQLGYLPDGRGLHYKNKVLHYAETVILDDDLVLYFTKAI